MQSGERLVWGKLNYPIICPTSGKFRGKGWGKTNMTLESVETAPFEESVFATLSFASSVSSPRVAGMGDLTCNVRVFWEPKGSPRGGYIAISTVD